MARTLDDLIKRLTSFEENLKSKAPSIIMKAGKEFLEQKKEQIMASGVGRYSKKKYSPGSLKSKALTGAGLSFLEGKIAQKEKTNWAELRQAEGLQIAHVDLWYSGQMWSSTVATKANQSTNVFWVSIGGRNRLSRNKLLANYKRYGDYLRPNEKQMQTLRNSITTNVSTLLMKRIR